MREILYLNPPPPPPTPSRRPPLLSNMRGLMDWNLFYSGTVSGTQEYNYVHIKRGREGWVKFSFRRPAIFNSTDLPYQFPRRATYYFVSWKQMTRHYLFRSRKGLISRGYYELNQQSVPSLLNKVCNSI
jgi:hypothetical protein